MKDHLLACLMILTVAANTLLIINEMGVLGALYLVTIAMGIYASIRYLSHTTNVTNVQITEEWAKKIALMYFKHKKDQAIELKKEAQK